VRVGGLPSIATSAMVDVVAECTQVEVQLSKIWHAQMILMAST
jgi:hypothetical protein